MQFFKRTIWSLLLLLPAACLTRGPDGQPLDGAEDVDVDAVLDLLTGDSTGGLSGGASNSGPLINPLFPQTVPELEIEGGIDSDGRTIPAADVSLRVDNRSGQAADVMVEFFIGDRIAHQSFLKLRASTPPITIGPELSTSIQASAVLADGSSAPDQRFFFEAAFVDPNTVLEYVIPAPAPPPPPPPPPDDEVVDPSEELPPDDVDDDIVEEEPPPPGLPPAPPPPPAPQGCFPITLNTLVGFNAPVPGAGVIELPNQTDCYTFAADAGRRIFFGFDGAEVDSSDFCSDGDIFVECLRPSGASLFETRSYFDEGGEPGFFILPESGLYTINVYGGFNTTGVYGFSVLDGDGMVQNFAADFNVAVSNGVPGPGAGNIEGLTAQDVYTFNAVPGQRVMFNGSIVGGGDVRWQVRDANNGFVFGPQFLSNAGLRTLDLGGTYTITVSTLSGGGMYTFTLISNITVPRDIAIDLLIGPDVPLPGDGRFPQNAETDFYRFNVASPQTVYFDGLPGGGGILWECRDPNGDTLFGPQFLDAFNDPGLFDLNIPGTYELEMYTSSGFASNGYSFIVRSVPPPTIIAFNVDDDPISGSFATPVDSFIYQFDGSADDDVYFNAIDGSGCDVFWRLESPGQAGTIFDECMEGSFDPGVIQLPEDGTYSIHVTPGFGAGTFSFEVVTPFPTEFFQISVGATIPDSLPGAGTLEGPGAVDEYALLVGSGETFFLDVTSSANDSYWTLTDTSSTYFDTEYVGFGQGPFTLPPGLYTLTVFNFNGNTDFYGFTVLPVMQPQACPIAVDTLVSLDVPCQGQSGQISPSFDRDLYTFTTDTPGEMFYFDVVGLNGGLAWTLTDPQGVGVFDTFFMNFDPGLFTLNTAGTYTVEVFSPFGGTGNYSFQIVTPAPPTMCAIGLDQFVTLNTPCPGVGHINSATDRDIMTFNAPLPDGQVVFDVSIINFNARWSVRETNGPFVFQGFAMNFDPGPRTLVPGAEYTITVESGNGGIAGNYAFTVVDVPPPQQFNIGYEQAVGPNAPAPGAGNLAAIGETDVYMFDGMAGDVVFFEVLQTNFGLRWQLDDPQGFRIFGPFSIGFNAGRFTLPIDGPYVITVTAPVGNSGDYGFIMHLCPSGPAAEAPPER